jgi:hypothetical protein
MACTKLNEKLYSEIPASDYGNTPAEIQTLVGRAYTGLRGSADNDVNYYPSCEYVFMLDEISSDEAVIPTRGTNWFDGGRYIEAKHHACTPPNLMCLSTWRYAYYGISNVNQVIYSITNSSLDTTSKNTIIAELRGLRAYYYLRLVDLFGNVPIVTSFTNTTPPSNSSRAQVYAFIESELTSILPYLSATPIYSRVTQPVVYTMLARLYLNSQVYIGTPRWQDCINACDKVTGYILEPEYFTNFLTANQVSKEIIFSVPYNHTAGTVGNYMSSMSFNYNQRFAFSATGNWPWSANGICGTPGLYRWFNDSDVRKKVLLYGLQINLATGTPVPNSTGDILSYTDTVTSLTNATENDGVRMKKYEVKDGETWERDHHFVLMRYAEILLMKAECLIRLGSPALAQPLIAQIRTRAGMTTPATVDLQFVNDEYRREFIFEGHRRTDNIRFGDFFNVGWEQPATSTSTATSKAIFPIPALEMGKNPNLVQNPGY